MTSTSRDRGPGRRGWPSMLHELRERGWSRAALGIEIGTSEHNVGRSERGESHPRSACLQRAIMRLLDDSRTSEPDLLRDVIEEHEKLVKRLRKLRVQVRQRVLKS